MKIENMKNESAQLYCVKCNSHDNIIQENANGIVVCSTCGTVMKSVYDETIEQKSYNDESKNTVERCSGITNAFLPQTSLGTTISGSPYNRLKKLQQWSAMPYKEKSLYEVLKTIQTKCRESNILKCIEDDAKILYKNISESKHEKGINKGKVKIIRGKNRKGLIAACVFYACKRKGKSKGPKEIAKIFALKYKELTKGCKIFKKLMKMKYMPYDRQVAKPEHYIADYCKTLDLDKNICAQATTLAINIQILDIASTHIPVSVAIGSILVTMKSNGKPVFKNHIAAKLNMSAVTVSKTQKKIIDFSKKHGSLLFNSELVGTVANLYNEEKKNMNMPEKFKMMHQKVIKNERSPDLDSLIKNDLFDNYIETKINESNKIVNETNQLFIDIMQNWKPPLSYLSKNDKLDEYINVSLNNQNC
jgi:transcription initiation factor TFIIIB Brf1 subunit/transcription initiation factor TFIIB